MKDLAIIVPYRDRESHLKQFVPHLSNHLNKQKLSFDIYIIEQYNLQLFNRGWCKNVGFVFSIPDQYKNVVFHDIDLLPHEDVDYTPQDGIIHLATHCEQYGYEPLPYATFGGVLMSSPDIFRSIQGYSNMFKGWGEEDNNLLMRIIHQGLEPLKRPSKFYSLPHDRINQDAEQKRNIMVNQHRTKVMSDGLSNLRFIYDYDEELSIDGYKYRHIKADEPTDN